MYLRPCIGPNNFFLISKTSQGKTAKQLCGQYMSVQHFISSYSEERHRQTNHEFAIIGIWADLVNIL